MYVISNFKFFNNASGAAESNVLHNPNKSSVLTIEVQASGDIELEIQGLVNTEMVNADYTSLAAIDMNGLSVTKKITKAGIYSFGVDGINMIKAVLTSGSGVTVFGRIGE